MPGMIASSETQGLGPLVAPRGAWSTLPLALGFALFLVVVGCGGPSAGRAGETRDLSTREERPEAAPDGGRDGGGNDGWVSSEVVPSPAPRTSQGTSQAPDRSTVAGKGARVRPGVPRPGAAGAGDPYYPELGNGGYDVRHYEVELEVDMETGAIDARVVLDGAGVQDLSSFHLDLWHLTVRSVLVNGEEARFTHEGRELAITPRTPIANGQRFTCEVRYDGVPELAPDASVAGMGIPGVGWWKRDSGVYVLSECTGGASWLPCNDHPRDKATMAFAVTVAKPWQVAANGLLERVDDHGDAQTWYWRASDPMATYLATVNVVQLELEESTVALQAGEIPLRLYYPSDAEERELVGYRKAADMLVHFEELFGPYPFEAYGGLLAPEEFGGALETQTLPVYSRGMGESTVVHELAHQWFGNCVTPSNWADMWLNEGFASYAEWLWIEHQRGKQALERRARRSYRYLIAREVGSPADPGVEEVFSSRTYGRGAFVLHLLRLEVGDVAFFELLRRWVADHHDRNASTADFVAFASRVTERDLTDFFDRVLYADVTPEDPRFEGDGK